jgi:Glycosyltransferase family 87
VARYRAVAICSVLGLSVYASWLGFGVQTTGDYRVDYAPAMNALLAGHVGSFFTHLPTNGAGGSVLLRAPAALLGKLVVGTQLAIFRFGALECMLLVGGLGLLLARRVRTPMGRVAVISGCVLSPMLLDAIRFGHPEEPLGAALCVGAVLLAGGGRSGWAGALLGLAVINKPWGVLAVGPVLLAARERRDVLAGAAGAIAVLWTAAAYALDPSHFGRIVLGASTSVVAHPVDLWWPLAHLHTAPGVEPAYFPPHPVSAHARELVVALAVPLSFALLRRTRRSSADCLALLALLFLLRCMLDPSNHVYYQVPLLIALVAWEAWLRRPPLLALLATGGFWLVFHPISGTGSLTAQFVAYLLVSVPLLLTLGRAIRGPGGIVSRRDRDRSGQLLSHHATT